MSVDRLTLAAFVALVTVGGLSSVAVRIGSVGLPPFWGSFLRFASASLILFAFVLVARLPLPRGRALLGALLFGVIGFAASYAFFYVGIVHVEAGLAQLLMSLIPLMTVLFAVVHRVEILRPRPLVGAGLATIGVGVVSAEQIGLAVPLLSVLAIVASAACAAEAGVLVKAFPQSHLVSFNAVSMGMGAALLFALSVIAGEERALPDAISAWLSLAYLVPVGSIGVFLLYIFVLQRWTASATSYMFVLTPFVTIAVGAGFAGERITIPLLLGGALVLVGVYLGALSGRAASPTGPRAPMSAPAALTRPLRE